VPRLVDDLRRLEELGVGTRDDLDQVAADEHGPVLAIEEDAQPPGREAMVELRALPRRQPIPERRAVDVDQLVRDHPAVEVDRQRPVDVARDVPLIALGVFIQAAKFRLLDRVRVLK
jgi:hypothetical protein